MRFSWRDLANQRNQRLVDQTFDLKSALMTRDPHGIISASPFRVRAALKYQFQMVNVTAHLHGGLTVPSSRSLVPVKLPLAFNFTEIYVRSNWALKRYEQEHPHGNTVLLVNHDGMIDFTQALIDNIILQIPVRVLSPEEKRRHLMPKGNGWRVISERDYRQSSLEAKSKQIDPRLAKLKNYFKK